MDRKAMGYVDGMKVRFLALADRVRASLFVLPTVCVLAAAGLALGSIHLDRRLGDESARLPLGFSSTVDSARAVLSTVAGATITVAGIAFSIALLVIQLASSQYSPRVVHGLFRDPFNKRVMGVVVGTFAYCLVVLRAVRSALEDGGDPVVPNVSVAIAVLLGLASILAIVGFINHNAHTMDVSEILERVTADTVDRLCETWPDEATPDPTGAPPVPPPGRARFSIEASERGWVQYIEHGRLLEALPADGTLQLETGIGRYVIAGAPLATAWLAEPPSDELTDAVRDAVRLGRTRTMAQDPAYGVRQLVDVALRALSPGVNDPTTAQDAIVHLGGVLAEAYVREAPPKWRSGPERRIVLEPHAPDHRSLTELALAELRRAARQDPAVVDTIFATIGAVAHVADIHEHAAATELRHQARATLEAALGGDLLGVDRQAIIDAYERHIGSHSVAPSGIAASR
ncbi:MAG: DUF2254 domain-containing protein [Acidimicrobiia bacterium]